MGKVVLTSCRPSCGEVHTAWIGNFTKTKASTLENVRENFDLLLLTN